MVGTNAKFVLRVVTFNIFCLDLKFAPKRVNVVLLILHPYKLHEVAPDGRMCAVSSNHKVKFHFFNLLWAGVRDNRSDDLKSSLTSAKIGPSKLVVKVEGDIWGCLKDVKQSAIQICPIDCVYVLQEKQKVSNSKDLIHHKRKKKHLLFHEHRKSETPLQAHRLHFVCESCVPSWE